MRTPYATRTHYLPWSAAGVLATLSFLLVLWATAPHGPGLANDSITYLEVAKNIRDNTGVVDHQGRLVNEWPPAFPVAVACVSKATGLNIQNSARWLNAVLAGGFILLFCAVLIKLGIHHLLISLLLAMVAVSSVFQQYTWFLSEGLFLVLLMASFHFFLQWSVSGGMRAFIAAAFLTGCMCLVRYAGAGIMAGMIFYMFFIQSGTIGRRSIRVGLFLLVFLLVMTPWIIYTSSFGEAPAHRKFLIHLIPQDKLFQLVQVPVSWFIPGRSFSTSRTLFLTVTALLTIWKWEEVRTAMRYVRDQKIRGIILIITIAVAYALFILFTISFLDANIPLDERILTPLYPLLMLLIAQLLDRLFASPWWFVWSVSFCMLIIVHNAMRSSFKWNHFHRSGIGFNSTSWKNSDIVRFAASQPDKVIHSNAWDILGLHLKEDRERFRSLPRMWDPATRQPIPELEEEMSLLKASVQNGESILIYANKVDWREYSIGKEELLEYFAPHERVLLKDGMVIMKANTIRSHAR